MAAERLQKILSRAGVASRRHAEELIVAGRVAVNGVVCKELGSRADAETDLITLDGVPVVRDRFRYVALNKPAGVLSTADDEMGRTTVVDLVPGEERVYPAGRLDRESEGLMLLTNDGTLTNLLTHPRHEVEKEYLVQIDRPLGERSLQRMVRGIDDEGERLRVRSVAPAAGEGPDGGAWLSIVLTQGRKREIRRMLARLEREVLVLRRVRVGPLFLGDLPTGEARELTAEEVAALYATVARGPA